MSSIRNNLTLEDAHEVIDINEMLARKRISTTIFKPASGLGINSDISKHVAWAYKHIYRYNYASGEPRILHGILHVSRVALYVPVLINFYRRYAITKAEYITTEQMQLLQIAAIFHDAARENEGKDYWDNESGIILYLYLTRVLRVEKTVALGMATAVANKDLSQTTGVYMMEEQAANNSITCNFIIDPLSMLPDKNIFQMLIHDADCLDVIRARPYFKGEKLDFYKQLTMDYFVTNALDELAQLIVEVRALIHLQGNAYFYPDPELREKYNNENALQHILADLSREYMPILFSLSVDLIKSKIITKMSLIDTTPYQADSKLTPANLLAAMRSGKVLVRCIPMPSNISSATNESLIDLDLRKCFRTTGIATRSNKPNNMEKNGNRYRSTSPICPGSGVFSSAGFFILNPDIEKMHHVASRDIGTGRGKKRELIDALSRKEPQTLAQKLEKYSKLVQKLKLGGNVVIYKGQKIVQGSHAEAIYDIDAYHAIFYTNDPTLNNHDIFRKPKLFHQYTSLLQAIHIHYAYQKRYALTLTEYINTWGEMNGTLKFHARFGANHSLPIFYYSGIQNVLMRVNDDDISEDKIIFYWIKMCQSMLDECFKLNDYHSIINSTLESIKIYMMYGSQRRVQEHKPCAADSNYPPALKARLDEALTNIIHKKLSIHSTRLTSKIYSVDLCKHALDMISLVICQPALFNDEQMLLIAHATILMPDMDIEYLNKTRNYQHTLFEFRKNTLTENFLDILSTLQDTSGFNLFRQRINKYNHVKLFKQVNAETSLTSPTPQHK